MRKPIRCLAILGLGLLICAWRPTGQASAAPQVMDARSVAAHLWGKHDLFETSVHGIVRCNAHLGAPRFRLAYMPCRNRGEILRLILEEAQVPYDLEVVGFKAWKEGVKATTPHGKLPCLRDYDGQGNDLCQETAITRFLAQSLGLAGRDAEQQALVDSLHSFWFATLRNNGVSHDGEHYSVAALKDCDPQQVESVPSYQEVFRQNTRSKAERSLMALRFFEETLKARGTGFLAGEAPTYADLGLFYILFELAEEDNVPDFAERFSLPELGAFLARMSERPQLAEYLTSPRRMPRYERDSSGSSLYTYVTGRFSPEIS